MSVFMQLLVEMTESFPSQSSRPLGLEHVLVGQLNVGISELKGQGKKRGCFQHTLENIQLVDKLPSFSLAGSS